VAGDGANERSRIGRWLAHPLLLLTLGAVFTWFFGPYLTHQWQDRQQALDDQRAETQIKTQLIQKIAQVTEEEITPIDVSINAYLRRGDAGLTHAAPALADASKPWPRDAAVIEAELRAWFPEPAEPISNGGRATRTLIVRWKDLESVMFAVEDALTSPLDLPGEVAFTRKLVLGEGEVAVKALAAKRRNDPVRDPLTDMKLDTDEGLTGPSHIFVLPRELRDARDRLIRAVLASKATGFSS
jgi:hypothetical protein